MIKKTSSAFTLIELLVVIAIIAILASIALPAFSAVQERAKQTKDLSNGKQAALALKQFALDNNGVFPNRIYGTGVPYDSSGPLVAGSTSNDALRWLVPTYTNSEDIFVVPGSSWSVGDDNSLDAVLNVSGGLTYPVAGGGVDNTTLASGEVGYAYVSNLNDTSNPQFPLLVDGFQIATTAGGTTGGTYPNDKTITGGVWGGTRAVVIFVDGSGRVMKCDGGAIGTQFVSRPGRIYNICSTGEVVTEGWLSTSNFILNPAGAGP
jgi:prepilin-type N-terminal cleavage/methylation domain-containing protein